MQGDVMMNFIYGMTTMALIGMVTGVTPERAIENLHAWARLFREFVSINRQSPSTHEEMDWYPFKAQGGG